MAGWPPSAPGVPGGARAGRGVWGSLYSRGARGPANLLAGRSVQVPATALSDRIAATIAALFVVLVVQGVMEDRR